MAADISIIIAYFNAEATIAETLESVYQETLRDSEVQFTVIAVNDGSTDNSFNVVESFRDRLSIKNETLEHTGTPAQARNHGVSLAETKYIFFLDADDLVLPNGLVAAVKFAEQHNSDIVVPRLKSIGGRGVPRGMHKGNQPKVGFLTSRVYWSNNPMKVVRTQLVRENNITFNTFLRKDSDQQFILKCYLAAKVISVLSDPPAIGYRYTPTLSNLTLRPYKVSFCTDYLDAMVEILDQHIPDRSKQFPLLIRNWEIEIARELIWKRLAVLPRSEWQPAIDWLHNFAKSRLIPEMLPKTSIRWRGIVGLIGTNNFSEIEKLLVGRERVLRNKNFVSKAQGIIESNWIRLKATAKLPKSFS